LDGNVDWFIVKNWADWNFSFLGGGNWTHLRFITFRLCCKQIFGFSHWFSYIFVLKKLILPVLVFFLPENLNMVYADGLMTCQVEIWVVQSLGLDLIHLQQQWQFNEFFGKRKKSL
jgi:hypothetical protein